MGPLCCNGSASSNEHTQWTENTAQEERKPWGLTGSGRLTMSQAPVQGWEHSSDQESPSLCSGDTMREVCEPRLCGPVTHSSKQKGAGQVFICLLLVS